MTDTQAYWDGERWTEHVAPGAPSAAVVADDAEHSNRLTVWGVVLAVVVPLIGFVIGCVLLARKSTLAGVLVMVLAVGASVFWYDLYTEHQRTNCIKDNLDRAVDGLPVRDCG